MCSRSFRTRLKRTVTIELEGEQRKLYDAYAKLLKLYLEKQSKEEFKQSKLEVLKELTRLRQLCCGPSYFWKTITVKTRRWMPVWNL